MNERRIAAVAGGSGTAGELHIRRWGFPIPVPGGRSGDVVVVGDDRGDRSEGVYGAHELKIPKGHYPPPGECRIWFPGRPPGHQPPPEKCGRLVGRVPVGAFVLYNDKAWDTRHDWDRQEGRNRGSVPEVILRVMRSLRGS